MNENIYEEQFINDILDKGIDEFKGNSLKSSMLNVDSNESKNPKSSALKHLLQEIKNDYRNREVLSNNISQVYSNRSDSVDLNFNDMKYEINDLQSKIEGLEKRISKHILINRF
jgi:hypothetical protein